MTHIVFDTSPVDLTGTITSTSALDLLHGSTSLNANNDSLLVELDVLPETEIIVADFVHDSTTHQIYAWDVLATGALEPWDRDTGCSRSGARATMDADVLMIAVPPGVQVPTPTSPSGPPAPGTTQSTVKIKIKPHGDTRV